MADSIGSVKVEIVPDVSKFAGKISDAIADMWFMRVSSFLNDSACSHTRSYYAPGELTDSAVVISVQRVTAAEYDSLASGGSDYTSTITPAS